MCTDPSTDSRRASAALRIDHFDRHKWPGSGWVSKACVLTYIQGPAQEEQLDSALPLLGIAATVGGYTVMEAQADVLECIVTVGLTEDAVTARLHEGGLVNHPRCLYSAGPDLQATRCVHGLGLLIIDVNQVRLMPGGLAAPLFLHTSVHSPGHVGALAGATPEVEWTKRIKQIFGGQVSSDMCVVRCNWTQNNSTRGSTTCLRRKSCPRGSGCVDHADVLHRACVPTVAA